MNLPSTQLSPTLAKPYYEPQTSLDLVSYNRERIAKFDSESGVTEFPVGFDKGTNGFAKTAPAASVDDLYYQPAFTSSELNTGLRLLAECLRFVETAIEDLRRGETFDADDAVLHIQIRIPEIYCCRNLSRGFSVVVNSLRNALNNSRGQPFDDVKLTAIRSLLYSIRNEPFMKYETALDLVMEFEDKGFIVEPEGFDILAEMFNV